MIALAVSPHPDDEVLGCGGTLHRLAAAGHHCVVAIVTKGWAPLFPDEQVTTVREEAGRAAAALGVRDLRFLDLPVVKLTEVPTYELNAVLSRLLDEVRPNWVFLPFPWDRHADHRRVFEAAMVSLRPAPARAHIERVFCYETLSETHWHAPGIEMPFDPQFHVEITGPHLAAKMAAMRCYASQLQPPPSPRSLDAIEGLARLRGANAGVAAAESFMLAREVWRL